MTDYLNTLQSTSDAENETMSVISIGKSEDQKIDPHSSREESLSEIVTPPVDTPPFQSIKIIGGSSSKLGLSTITFTRKNSSKVQSLYRGEQKEERCLCLLF
ncbi:hypothetical protein SteCoe_17493 [Stentor coeruleus]|uniref:Uncharacterized protein n=1 Tax=Stentor coeruleus TaxID=5963 RepID=A0A1R2BYS9_9CILI|nr:hypothetical protein SteCoe_17493 [Stentor coeruleus]